MNISKVNLNSNKSDPLVLGHVYSRIGRGDERYKGFYICTGHQFRDMPYCLINLDTGYILENFQHNLFRYVDVTDKVKLVNT